MAQGPGGERRPPPPSTDDVAFETKGAVGGRVTRATYPFGRFRATADEVAIWFDGGELWPSIRASRAEVEAIEFRRGLFGRKYWIVLQGGRQWPTWFMPLAWRSFALTIERMGWPVRERRRSAEG